MSRRGRLVEFVLITACYWSVFGALRLYCADHSYVVDMVVAGVVTFVVSMLVIILYFLRWEQPESKAHR